MRRGVQSDDPSMLSSIKTTHTSMDALPFCLSGRCAWRRLAARRQPPHRGSPHQHPFCFPCRPQHMHSPLACADALAEQPTKGALPTGWWWSTPTAKICLLILAAPICDLPSSWASWPGMFCSADISPARLQTVCFPPLTCSQTHMIRPRQ